MTASVILIFSLSVACWSTPAQATGKKFLDTIPGHHKFSFQEEVELAMDAALGCGGEASAEKKAAVTKTLKPMYRTMPKTSHGRIDRRTLRYVVHRYFMQTSSLLIRGFEPTRPVNESYWGVADILSQVVPAYVESVLESHHATQHGFTFKDTVSMVLMLDQLIFDSERNLLRTVYSKQQKPPRFSLDEHSATQILEEYMVRWMVEAEPEDLARLLEDRSLVSQVVPHYEELMRFIQGRVKTLKYNRDQKIPKTNSGDVLQNRYSFEDVHEIVGGITNSFQSFWQSECDTMKGALVSMDPLGTGRIPLAKFYHSAINKDWRFGESEAYLRELGALDESSTSLGPQVIIPNYVQASSNCIVSAPHYLVCCANECESLLGEIEAKIGTPTATPKDILQIVANMTSQTTLEDDESPDVAPEGRLAQQLQQVANINSGTVPLHGRLFAQWLHYVFPRECPFPHRMGVVSSVTPLMYGDDHIATEKDMKKHALNSTAHEIHSVAVTKDDLQWMSQWSPEEEFIVDYSAELSHMSWQTRVLVACVGALLMGLAAWGGVIHSAKQPSHPSSMAGRVHWI